MQDDWGPRAIPLLAYYATLLEAADLVLHASDRVFDLGFDELPPRHHYVGPLGIWEPPSDPPAYLAEPGDPGCSSRSARSSRRPPARRGGARLAGGRAAAGPAHRRSRSRSRRGRRHAERSDRTVGLARGGARTRPVAGEPRRARLGDEGPVVRASHGARAVGARSARVAARAAALGVAQIVSPDEAAAGGIAAAVRRTLSDGSMVVVAAHHRDRLRATDPPGTAAGLVEGLL